MAKTFTYAGMPLKLRMIVQPTKSSGVHFLPENFRVYVIAMVRKL